MVYISRVKYKRGVEKQLDLFVRHFEAYSRDLTDRPGCRYKALGSEGVGVADVSV